MKKYLRMSVTMAAFGFLLHQTLLAQPPKQRSPAEEYLSQSLDGRALYQNYCAVCHGDDARGTGPMAKALRTLPPDLTQISVRNAGAFPVKKVEQIITGEGPFIVHGTREMPLWGPIFSQIAWDQDLGRLRVANLIKYLESIQTARKPGPAPQR